MTPKGKIEEAKAKCIEAALLTSEACDELNAVDGLMPSSMAALFHELQVAFDEALATLGGSERFGIEPK